MTDLVTMIDGDPAVPEDLYSSWSPTLSPDARRVAFVSDRDGEPQVWTRALDGGPLVAVPLAGCRVTGVSWSPTGKWLACSVAPDGSSCAEVWVVRPDGTGARRIAGRAPCTAEVAGGRSQGWTADGSLVVTETGATAQVLTVRPDDGYRTLQYEGFLLTAVDVSTDGRTLLVRQGRRGRRALGLVVDGQARPVVAAGGGSSESGCLSPDGTVVYACTDATSERARLESGPLVVDRPDAELEAVALSGDGQVAALTWNVDGGLSALTILDIASGHQREVTPLPRSVVHRCRLSHDGGVVVVTAEGPSDPKGVWHGPTGSTLRALSSPGQGSLRAAEGATAASIDPSEVVAPTLHRLTSSDATPISGWLLRPAVAGPAPTFIWLHGGPEAQERPVYNSLFQTLLAEGIAVFAPNVRGSSGFGRTFRSADNGAGRYGAFADVAACAAYLTDAGIAAPGRLGVGGRSYGGYLTLAMLTRFPELFAVGVAVCAMSDLGTWYATTEAWIGAAAVSKYGDPVRDRELLADLSPLPAMDRLRAPLLLVHGTDDTNVPVTESVQVAAALDARKAPHRLLLFEAEGHELLATANRVQFVQATTDWLTAHLQIPV
ncbi:MAG: S9 family peptidase [Acidimicrobiales bacterium]